MSCQGCKEKEKDVNRSNKYNEAQQLANQSGQWYILFFHEQEKEWNIIRADLANGLPGRGEYISPKLQNT